jgi:hypothetical protein
MQISCPQCSHIHEIEDKEADDKKIYFFCAECGHKIVVDNRKHITVPAQESPVIIPVQTSDFSDILDALPGIFNLRRVMHIFGYLCLSAIVLTAIAILFFKVPEINMPIKISVTVLFLLCIHYGLLLVLYLVSKDYYIKSGIVTLKNNATSLANFPNDSLSLFLVSFVLIGVTTILIVPVYLIGKDGLFYGGILFPVFLFLFILIALSIIFCHYFPAFLAIGEYRTVQGIKSFFSFIRSEFAALLFHYFTVGIIHSIYTGIMIIIFGTSFFLLNIVITTLSHLGGITETSGLAEIPNPKGILSLFTGFSDISTSVYAFFILLTVLFFTAFLATAYQTLVSQSCAILKNNPVNSVPKRLIIAVCGIVFVLFVLLITKGIIIRH